VTDPRVAFDLSTRLPHLGLRVRELSNEELAAAGISPGLVRMSIGYTNDFEERWAQLERGLKKVGILK